MRCCRLSKCDHHVFNEYGCAKCGREFHNRTNEVVKSDGFMLCNVFVTQGKNSAKFMAEVKVLGRKSGSATRIYSLYAHRGFNKRSLAVKIPIAFVAPVFEHGSLVDMRRSYVVDQESLEWSRLFVRGMWCGGILADKVVEFGGF